MDDLVREPSSGNTTIPLAAKQWSANFQKELKDHERTGKPMKQGKFDIKMEEHLMSVEDVVRLHETDITNGLTTEQVAAKIEQYGTNELKPPPSKPWWIIFLSHMTGFFSLLLWLASILCFFAYGLDSSGQENLYLGVVLAIVVFCTGVFSYYQDAKSAAVMEGFKNFLPSFSTVLRNGRQEDIDSAQMVPGDIVLIKSGQKCPADFRVVKDSNFKVDNSSLTGESDPQKRVVTNTKKEVLEATNIAFYGTLCVSGNATGIVVATGDNTAIGVIANLAASTEAVETPISIEIHHFIAIVSYVAVFLGVSFLIIGFFKGTAPVANLVFAIGIIVANVPEGLLATVTVSLTLTAKRMAFKKVLVKNLEAVETLGSTTVIASDKTGTLTQNRMTVAHVFYDLKTVMAHGEGPGSFNPEEQTFKYIQRVATLCNTATFKTSEENMAKKVLQRDTNGDASESAMIKFCEPLTPIMEMRANNRELAQIPFNSANKYQLGIYMTDNDASKPRFLAMKGAPERIWNRCDMIMVEGKPVPITREIEETYRQAMAALMSGGERVLGTCCIELDPNEFPEDFHYDTEADEGKKNFPMEKGSGLVFTGLMSLIDPPRAAVPSAVKSCQKAGIKVVMVTGDHPDTAEAIAKQVHIIRDATRRDIANDRNVPMDEVPIDDEAIKAVVITGAQLAELTVKQLDSYLDYDQIVFARTSPKQKLNIVQGLQNKTEIRRGYPADAPKSVHHVVAVTGDGVNDSPALKAADIGVAMGIVGSDVAKDAADMILLNDNFASIVDGVEEGRLIFDNLKKSIAYTLSSNIPEISPFLVFILVSVPLPLTTVLILCIDLGTDMVPAISLAYEPKEANIMLKPPRDMNTERLVTAKLVSFSYLQVGIVQALAGFYAYFVVLNDYGFLPSILPGLADYFEDKYIFPDPEDPEGPPLLKYGNDKYHKLEECNITGSVCHDPEEALAHAQAAFFVSIIIVQWADIVACKTRTLSLQQQGMRNGMLNFGLVFETALGFLLCYVEPLNSPLGTRPIEFVHWLPALPFSIFIISYDELRKFFLRNMGKNNWVERNTYY